MAINAQWHLCPGVSDCWRLHRGAPRSPAVEWAGHPGAAADSTHVSTSLHYEMGAGSLGLDLGTPPSLHMWVPPYIAAQALGFQTGAS